jgi:hypothetical protein
MELAAADRSCRDERFAGSRAACHLIGPEGERGWSTPGDAGEFAAPHHVHPDDRKEVPPMVVMIGQTGVYLILALVFLAIFGGGVIVAYRMGNRKNE